MLPIAMRRWLSQVIWSVSSLGSWSFRGRQAPHDDVRVGRLIVCSGVWTSHLQPIHRGRRNHRPSGTSPARRTEPGTIDRRSSCLLLAPLERSTVDPDTMEDHCNLPGDLAPRVRAEHRRTRREDRCAGAHAKASSTSLRSRSRYGQRSAPFCDNAPGLDLGVPA
jgi:hypothetical protein